MIAVRRRLAPLIILGLLAVFSPRVGHTENGVVVRVLSNRADLISAGDALVVVDLAAGVDPSSVTVTAGGADVTNAFAVRENGSFEGLVTGMDLGPNVITATTPAGSDSITVVNHPNGGPVFSGPQIQPWTCTNEGAVDAQCNAPTTFELLYVSSLDGAMHPYDPASPPSDVADTTTDNGQTVPFIVRVETGYQDRDEYKIAVLYQPDLPWTAWNPQPQFNHKLLITHGASCGIERVSASAPSVTGDTVGIPGAPALASSSPQVALGMGFAVMSTALNNAGHNCNIVTQAESLVMAKEHLIEQYGTLRYTIGTGCSGGSLTQQQVANAYPGIYQGILPQCSFQDVWSNAQQIADYHATRLYFEDPRKWGLGVVWLPHQVAAVEGHPNHGNSIIFDTVYWTSLAIPDDGCPGVEPSETYNAATNPGGVRCTLADYMINVFGPRPAEQWGPVEQELGHGFAGLPVDNVGVQYGLNALKAGTITPAQFVDLNAKVGGADIDINPTASRIAASTPALRRSYASGAVNMTNNLKDVAIIDLRGPDPGAFHDAYRSWSIRARLEREEGRFPKNHVIWVGPVPLIGDPRYTVQGLLAMDRWLSAVEADTRPVSLEQKVAEDRPADVHDQCSSIPGVELVALPGIGPVCELDAVLTKYATPRIGAGEGIAADQQKCVLKPLVRSDYYPISFTDDQWAALAETFPTGVCDFSVPGVDQVPTVPWQTYQDAGGGVGYGGVPLGPAPAGSGEGWTAGVFGGWL